MSDIEKVGKCSVPRGAVVGKCQISCLPCNRTGQAGAFERNGMDRRKYYMALGLSVFPVAVLLYALTIIGHRRTIGDVDDWCFQLVHCTLSVVFNFIFLKKYISNVKSLLLFAFVSGWVIGFISLLVGASLVTNHPLGTFVASMLYVYKNPNIFMMYIFFPIARMIWLFNILHALFAILLLRVLSRE